ncbi:MAG: hypothetical protein ACI37Z_03560 [Candidatus Gastranaerophilaceae bacterium]
MSKFSIRRGVFETNSSSTHSLSVCDKTDFDEWVNGKLIADMSRWDLELIKFLTPEEAKKEAFSRYQEEYHFSQQKMEDLYLSNKENFFKENHLFTFEAYKQTVYQTLYEADTYRQEKQIGGQDVVIFGHYGRDD